MPGGSLAISADESLAPPDHMFKLEVIKKMKNYNKTQ